MVGVECALNHSHRVYHCFALGVVQKVRLLDADSMLGAHTTLGLSHVVHHEWFNELLHTPLQVLIIVAREHHIQMQIAITYMAVTIWQNLLLF